MNLLQRRHRTPAVEVPPAPTPASVVPPPSVLVGVVGTPAQVQALVLALPPRWGVVPTDAAPQVVVVLGTDPDVVRHLLVARPRTAVLAVVPDAADAGVVVRLLDAGADGCLRGFQPAEVVAHLVAVERRRAARLPVAC